MYLLRPGVRTATFLTVVQWANVEAVALTVQTRFQRASQGLADVDIQEFPVETGI
jgi:hypothetical protein